MSMICTSETEVIAGTVSNCNKKKDAEVKLNFHSPFTEKPWEWGDWEGNSQHCCAPGQQVALSGQLQFTAICTACVTSCSAQAITISPHPFMLNTSSCPEVLLNRTGLARGSCSNLQVSMAQLQAGCNITAHTALVLLSLLATIPLTPTQ